MKSKYALRFLLAGALLLADRVWAEDQSYTAHEWGTFTSFQGAEGTPLTWRPFQNSELPQFVYNSSQLGLTRGTQIIGGKGIWWLQRMETPVIYFYSDDPIGLDVTVRFPSGIITEWFPQANLVGGSLVGGLMPAPDAASNDTHATVSGIRWPHLTISPAKKYPGTAKMLPGTNYWPGSIASSTNAAREEHPLVNANNRYFRARETDSDMVESMTNTLSNTHPDFEKFLFYRGAGNFGTPLRVAMKSDDTVTLINSGKGPLEHLFVLGVKGKSGKYVYVDELPAGGEKTVSLDLNKNMKSAHPLARDIGKEMARALEKTGLYPREATAMVNTWSDSWFAEDGVRVLYTLPRKWTDQTLPITLNPAPKKLVRVMVGRAEIFSPETERSLTEQISKAKEGDAQASEESKKMLRSLGRFATPAFYHVLQQLKPQPQEQGRLMALLNASQAPD